MKAIRIHSYGHSDQLKIEEIPNPKIKDDNEVVVKIHAVGVNPVDWKIREGNFKDFMPASFPLTIGQDFSGEIAEVGNNVHDFPAGDQVFGFVPSGAYAEYADVSVKELARKPESIDFVTAASVPTAGLTAWQMIIDEAKVSEGQVVLIHGAAGGVGSFATQLAKWKKARVIATASQGDTDYLKSIGVDQVIDYKSERFEEKVKDVDAVIDLIGGETQAHSYRVLKKGGGGVIISTVGLMDEAEAKKWGARGISFRMTYDGSGLTQIAKLVDQGILKPRVDKVLPLTDAKKAQDLNQTGQSHGKMVLQVI